MKKLGLDSQKSDQNEYISNHDADVMIQHNSVMRDYVKLTSTFVLDDVLMKKILNKSIPFATSLKPKPTTKKKLRFI